MLATVINVILVLLGSALGLIFKNRISARFSSGLMFALGLCVLGIGISNMIRTNDTLCVIICMVLGTLLGEGLNIEKRWPPFAATRPWTGISGIGAWTAWAGCCGAS